jgi:hypothetical integral membrane protein (TIGR02206 family)
VNTRTRDLSAQSLNLLGHREAFYNLPVINLPSSIIATTFHTFGTQHLAALIGIAILCLVTAKVTRAKRPSWDQWLKGIIGFFLVSYIVFFYVQQGIKGALAWQYSLPLDLCSLVLVVCIISLFRPNRFIIEFAYFCGIGGVLQALATPDLSQGFPSVEFILFFWGHGASLTAITFLVLRHGFRPRKGSVLRMMIALNLYALAIGTVNIIMGWNYGYLCHKPFAPSLIDFLGPWPLYLLSIEVIALVTFLILSVPWRFQKQ